MPTKDFFASKINPNFVSKGYIDISQFRHETLTLEHRNEYADQGKLIKYMRWHEPSEHPFDICRIWIDNEGNYVCSISYSYPDDVSTDDKISINGLDVAYKYRGYGISKQLIELVMARGWNISLMVHPHNEVALKLYENMGFVATEESIMRVKRKETPAYIMEFINTNCRKELSMKNYMFKRLLLTTQKKRYASSILLREGPVKSDKEK